MSDHPRDGHASPGIAWIGRIGLAARGIIYFVIGVLALLSGLGLAGGKISDQRQALGTVARLPFGQVLLWAVAIGLACFVLWRVTQIIWTRKWTTRFIAIVSAAAYSSVVSAAILQAAGARGSSGSGERALQTRTEWLLSQPLGQWLVLLAALLICAAAIYQFTRAWRASFAKHLQGGNLTPAQERWACRVGRIGHAARGVAFALIGSFFLRAGLSGDASEAGGLASAMRSVAGQPYGSALLALLGAALAMFGVWSLVEARCRSRFF